MKLSSRALELYKQTVNEHNANNYNTRQKILTTNPQILKIQNQINKLWIATIEDSSLLDILEDKISKLEKNLQDELVKNGYKKDSLENSPICNKCNDRGYVGSEMCSCLQAFVINDGYSLSNIKNKLINENFNTFNASIFSDLPNENLQKMSDNSFSTVRELMQFNYNKCKRFVSQFDDKCINLFFSGSVGTGKTFLTNCIAKELIDQGKNVIYNSAYNIIENMRKETLQQGNENFTESLFNCELLIIDDLGTERQTDHSQTLLYNIINERAMRNKSIIISTNKTSNELQESYDQRINSRLRGNFSGIYTYGEDIRLKLKI